MIAHVEHVELGTERLARRSISLPRIQLRTRGTIPKRYPSCTSPLCFGDPGVGFFPCSNCEQISRIHPCAADGNGMLQRRRQITAFPFQTPIPARCQRQLPFHFIGAGPCTARRAGCAQGSDRHGAPLCRRRGVARPKKQSAVRVRTGPAMALPHLNIYSWHWFTGAPEPRPSQNAKRA